MCQTYSTALEQACVSTQRSEGGVLCVIEWAIALAGSARPVGGNIFTESVYRVEYSQR